MTSVVCKIRHNGVAFFLTDNTFNIFLTLNQEKKRKIGKILSGLISSMADLCLLEKAFVTSFTWLTASSSFFFLSGFSFTNNHDSQESRGRGRLISVIPFYHFHPLHRHLDISQAITADSSPLHIVSSRSQTGNLWFPYASY